MVAKTDGPPPGKDLQVMMQVIGLLQSLAPADSDNDDQAGSRERVLRSVNAFFGHTRDALEDMSLRIDELEQQMNANRKGGL